MIKDLKNNFRILKYVFKCCRFYPFWSILLIISDVLNAVLKVSIIADVVKMVQEALLNNKNGEFQADVFKAIAIEIFWNNCCFNRI